VAFEKGKSGNPKGRPAKVVEEARQSVLARLFNTAAEELVVLAQIELAASGERGSTMAAKWLFDRKYGPLVAVEVEPQDITVRVEYGED
jgi:hypothetical protein